MALDPAEMHLCIKVSQTHERNVHALETAGKKVCKAEQENQRHADQEGADEKLASAARD